MIQHSLHTVKTKCGELKRPHRITQLALGLILKTMLNSKLLKEIFKS